jgi:hypothetical protein
MIFEKLQDKACLPSLINDPFQGFIVRGVKGIVSQDTVSAGEVERGAEVN